MLPLALITACIPALFGDKEDRVYMLHEKPLLHIAILSAAANRDKRDACRETWLRDLPSGVTATFMVLASKDPATVEHLYLENARHGDIHFVRSEEGYHQIPHSTMSAIAGASSRAAYLMKCDDDTYVRVGLIVYRLRRPGNPKFWLWGTISRGDRPARGGKWAITHHEYPHQTYPPFAHGPGYIVSGPLANWLASHPLKTFIKLEDVAMGIWVESARLAGVPVKVEHGHFPMGCSPRGFIAHYVSPDKMRCLWAGRTNCC
jgi:hypothetical protein